jgi:hypothetical protein
MNKESMGEVMIAVIALLKEHKELHKDLETALGYLARFGWSNEASREFYSMAKERWFRREDG